MRSSPIYVLLFILANLWLLADGSYVGIRSKCTRPRSLTSKCLRPRKQSNRRLTTSLIKRANVAKAVGRLRERKLPKPTKDALMLVTSALNYIYSCAFRRKPLSKTILAAKQIPLEYLIKKKILRSPTDYNYFIPEVHNGRAKSFMEQAKQPKSSSGHLSNSLNLLSVNWTLLNGSERGDVFERMHMSWWLAMRAHQASRTFLPDQAAHGQDVDSLAAGKLLFLYHKNRNTRDRTAKLLDTQPKANLRITHNEVKPLCNQRQNDEPFLLNHRYEIMQMPGKGKEAGLLGLPDSSLHRLLEGNIALKNVACGPGYDFVIVDWVPEGPSGFKLVFSFLEMRFSSNRSSLVQTMTEVEKKLHLISREFEALRRRLPHIAGVNYDYRLIMECFRDLEEDFDPRDLPDRVFLYDRVSLGRAYGPSLTNNSNLTSFDE